MQPNEKQTSTQAIYTELREEILALHLAPGTSLGETEMSKRFNISRTPIREVFKRLELEGLLNVIPNKGTIVTPINFAIISEFMYVREKLELGLVEDLLPTIQEQQLATLSINLKKQEKIIKDQHTPLSQRTLAFYDMDNQFHASIFGFMNKREIWSFIMDIMPDYIRYRALSAEFNTQEHMEELFGHHKEIVNAFEGKELDTLKSTYKQHIYYGIKTFRQLIEERESYFLL